MTNGAAGWTRREVLGAAAGLAAAGSLAGAQPEPEQASPGPIFRISLAQWSLHRALQGGAMDNLDFATAARETYGLEAVEYVNSFFKDHAADEAYLGQMKRRAADADVKSLLIMIDGEGEIGHPDQQRRLQVVDNHRKWADAAAFLGCHSIRVNAASRGTAEEQKRLAADGLRRLTEYGDSVGVNVIVENHGGLSSNGAWLASVIREVGHERCGTLPDFGNFCLDWGRKDEPDAWYDRYRGVEEMMPFAKAVSAKSHDFDNEGNETATDYRRMLKIVLGAGYRGYIGIEYEGEKLPEPEGIRATKRLLERVRGEMGGAN
ncbi:MAG: sugar phosphate isomerase/epimerase family protein [Phycisphaerales bacterium JB039]